MPKVLGSGKTGLKAGNRVHPGGASLLFTVVPDADLELALAFVRRLRGERPRHRAPRLHPARRLRREGGDAHLRSPGGHAGAYRTRLLCRRDADLQRLHLPSARHHPGHRPTGSGKTTTLYSALKTRGADSPEIKREAVKNGMRTLRQSALRKLAEGITTFEEVVRVTGL